jgi:hypothetical protein
MKIQKIVNSGRELEDKLKVWLIKLLYITLSLISERENFPSNLSFISSLFLSQGLPIEWSPFNGYMI